MMPSLPHSSQARSAPALSMHTRTTRSKLRPLQICIIGSTYPRHEQDYAVPWLRESVHQLALRGHRVTVLAPAYEGLPDHSIDGVPVVRFRYSPKCWERLTHEQGAPNRIRNPWYQLLGPSYIWMGCRAARQLARRVAFDLVHVHWPFPHEAIGSAMSRVCGAPLVMTAHGAEFALAQRKPWIAAWLKRSLRKASLLIANSTDTAARIHSLSGCAATILPFGSTITPQRRQPRPAGPPRVSFTGRLIQRKGVEYLLRAVPLVVARHDVHFVITGDGDERRRLESLAQELQIAQHVQFLGFVNQQELNHQYASCDLWVNPAIVDDRGDTEGLGVGAVEAYAHAKPVIASRVGGIPDAVIHQITGLLVPQKNPQALAAAILDLVQNPDKAQQLGLAGQRFAENRFHWGRITDELERLYLSVLPSQAPPQDLSCEPSVPISPAALPWEPCPW